VQIVTMWADEAAAAAYLFFIDSHEGIGKKRH
jgi:hypothetical protein